MGESARLSRMDTVRRQYKLVINWGNPQRLSDNHGARILNHPNKVSNAINKATALQIMHDAGVRVPTFSATIPQDRGGVWLARTTLTGSGGAGIKVVRKGTEFPAAPLYVRYVPKLVEARVHVVNGRAVFLQLKLRDSDAQQTEDQKLIRNYDNGWIFAPRPLDTLKQDALEEAVKAVAALGLDFGAVDLIIGKKDDKAYVLEVNTAPGLSSPGLIAAYGEEFTKVTYAL